MLKIIGSVALNHHLGYEYRPSRDIDIIGSMDHINTFIKYVCSHNSTFIRHSDFSKKDKIVYFLDNGMIVEAEIAENDNSGARFIAIDSMVSGNDIHASMEGLYALKMSHRYLKNSPAFLKTMDDIHEIRYFTNKTVIGEEWKEWFTDREKLTYNYGHPKLNVTRGEFFNDDGINYVYDHDSIHEAVALNYTPAYKKFLVDEVKVSRELFDKLPYFDQMAAVIEESMVLAIERSLVPFNFKNDPCDAYRMALSKVCTSITSGWFREFAWENYYTADQWADQPYDEWFKKALANGEIRPYVKKEK